MPWFQKLCRQAGLAVHKVTTPAAESKTTTTQVRRSVEESNPEPGVTLRRTTIEEIEFRGGDACRPRDSAPND